mmetsp:Transcript_13298/g.32139  ORF Transcript_13298/g.32139 Transcript_13298/m.32139 type:complete len:238 (+) Transcript_13298:4765-5478(+)
MSHTLVRRVTTCPSVRLRPSSRTLKWCEGTARPESIGRTWMTLSVEKLESRRSKSFLMTRCSSVVKGCKGSTCMQKARLMPEPVCPWKYEQTTSPLFWVSQLIFAMWTEPTSSCAWRCWKGMGSVRRRRRVMEPHESSWLGSIPGSRTPCTSRSSATQSILQSLRWRTDPTTARSGPRHLPEQTWQRPPQASQGRCRPVGPCRPWRATASRCFPTSQSRPARRRAESWRRSSIVGRL